MHPTDERKVSSVLLATAGRREHVPRRRLEPVMRASGLFFFLLAFLLGPAIAEGRTQFRGCDGPEPNVEPSELVLSCADAALRIEQLDWSRWDESGARANGVVTFPDCPRRVSNADCRHYAHDPGVLVLSQPRYCRKFRARVFQRATLRFSGDPRTGTPEVLSLSYPCPKPEVRKRHRWRNCGSKRGRFPIQAGGGLTGAVFVNARSVRCGKALLFGHRLFFGQECVYCDAPSTHHYGDRFRFRGFRCMVTRGNPQRFHCVRGKRIINTRTDIDQL